MSDQQIIRIETSAGETEIRDTVKRIGETLDSKLGVNEIVATSSCNAAVAVEVPEGTDHQRVEEVSKRELPEPTYHERDIGGKVQADDATVEGGISTKKKFRADGKIVKVPGDSEIEVEPIQNHETENNGEKYGPDFLEDMTADDFPERPIPKSDWIEENKKNIRDWWFWLFDGYQKKWRPKGWQIKKSQRWKEALEEELEVSEKTIRNRFSEIRNRKF